MIIGGLLIAIALSIYLCYKPKKSPKGSLGYYKNIWREL